MTNCTRCGSNHFECCACGEPVLENTVPPSTDRPELRAKFLGAFELGPKFFFPVHFDPVNYGVIVVDSKDKE